jgi:hypothetical protein
VTRLWEFKIAMNIEPLSQPVVVPVAYNDPIPSNATASISEHPSPWNNLRERGGFPVAPAGCVKVTEPPAIWANAEVTEARMIVATKPRR